MGPTSPPQTFETTSSPINEAISPDDLLSQAQDAINSGLLKHVAIIMDGNRRWAKAQGLAGFQGHWHGYQALKNLIAFCQDTLHLPVITVYAFSTENWNRPSQEVSVITQLLQRAIEEELKQLVEKNVRIRFLGDLSTFGNGVTKACQAIQTQSQSNTGLTFQIALNYGGRAELLRACQHLMAQAAEGLLAPDALTPEHLNAALYTGGIPDPDMIIRTGGESRLSNFLLWQAAYAELMIRSEWWPEFSPTTLLDTIGCFLQRHRRYGV